MGFRIRRPTAMDAQYAAHRRKPGKAPYYAIDHGAGPSRRFDPSVVTPCHDALHIALPCCILTQPARSHRIPAGPTSGPLAPDAPWRGSDELGAKRTIDETSPSSSAKRCLQRRRTWRNNDRYYLSSVEVAFF